MSPTYEEKLRGTNIALPVSNKDLKAVMDNYTENRIINLRADVVLKMAEGLQEFVEAVDHEVSDQSTISSFTLCSLP